MALSFKHNYITPRVEGPGAGPPAGVIGPNEWNHEHDVVTSTTTGIVVGKATGGAGALEELPAAWDATPTRRVWSFLTGQGLWPGGGPSTSRPASPAPGTLRWNSDTNSLEVYGVGGGTTWVDYGSIGMVGMIMMTGGNFIPNGWLFCGGQLVSRSTYQALWNVIGTTWSAGDGVNTFGLPNLADRVPQGAGGSWGIGSYAGNRNVQPPLRNHFHYLKDQYGTRQTFPMPIAVGGGPGAGGGANLMTDSPPFGSLNRSITADTETTGDGGAPTMDVTQPSTNVYFVIKY